MGIFLVINILANIGMADRFMAGIALVVGLHFIPIAKGLPLPAYFAIAAALIILSIAGFVLPSAQTAALVLGYGGALTMWLGALWGMWGKEGES